MQNIKNAAWSVPSVLKVIHDAGDETEIQKYENKLVCMFFSPVLLVFALLNFTLRYFADRGDAPAALLDSGILLMIGIGFEILLRVAIKVKPLVKAHLVSALFLLSFLYMLMRLYGWIGPAVWIYGILAVAVSMTQTKRILGAFSAVAIASAWVYTSFFANNVSGYTVSAIGPALVLVLGAAFAAVYQAYFKRLSRMKGQIKEFRTQVETSGQLAMYDQLTGLPNKALFQERLGKAFAQAEECGREVYALFLDLDMFKMINDTMGHTQGDELLKQVGRRLTAVVPEDDMVARIGGDEFLIYFKHVRNKNEVKKIANGILHQVNRPFILNQRQIFITCSFGISQYPKDAQDVETIIKYADLAMYKAKEEGKNRFAFFSDRLIQVAQYEMSMVTAMKNALLNDEFELYYQPQINGDTRELIGMEALIRWNHPTMGLLYPSDFIDVAEKSGLMGAIGKWTLRAACTQNKAWQNQGFAYVPVAVNISVNQICNDELAAQVAAVLKETELEPCYLELEITEKIIFKDIRKVKSELEKIRALGIKIAIDDFGMGDSSIYYLRELPVDCIKIPMDFIHGINKNVKDESIISVILALAEILKLEVIAEGVETKKQMDFLNTRLCRNIQGYYFSRPVRAKEAEIFCRAEANRLQLQTCV